mmetsp:Transcript_27165/g.63722  ORF Transcript_27165/g.63722 Transcript_27165/m.63722 type:complete len:324 (+) Transcript_27165:451-1422(+)
MAFSQSEACAQAEIAALNPTTLMGTFFSSTASFRSFRASWGFGGSDRAHAEIADEYTIALGTTPWSFSIDRSVSMALSAFRARLQAFISEPNVKTFGFRAPSDFVVLSNISKACFSLVGRALEQASMAPLTIRMLGRSMVSNIPRASSVFPFRPRPTIFRSRSAYESIFFCFLRFLGTCDDDDVVVETERAVRGFRRVSDDGAGQSFSSVKDDGAQALFLRPRLRRIESGANAFPLSVAKRKRKTKQETKSVLAIAICFRRSFFRCIIAEGDADVVLISFILFLMCVFDHRRLYRNLAVDESVLVVTHSMSMSRATMMMMMMM